MLVSLQGKELTNLERYRHLAKSNGKPILDSGNYRHGFTITDTKLVRPATYVLIASTYEEGQFGSFQITVASSKSAVEIQSIPAITR